MIRKHLRNIGNSYGVIIPKIYLEEMGINPVLDDVYLDVQNGVLTIKKAEKDDSRNL